MNQPVKKYTEILWNSKIEKETFFDTLIPLLESTRSKMQPRKSRMEYAERFSSAAIHVFWEVAWKEMIHNNRHVMLYKNRCMVSISKLPARHNERLGIRNLHRPVFVPFFSRKTGYRYGIVYFKLKSKLRNELNAEINKGHEYRYGKPTY